MEGIGILYWRHWPFWKLDKISKNSILQSNSWSKLQSSQTVASHTVSKSNTHQTLTTQPCFCSYTVLWTRKWQETIHLEHMADKLTELTHGLRAHKTMMEDSQLLTRTKMMINTSSLSSFSRSPKSTKVQKFLTHHVLTLLDICSKVWVKVEFMTSKWSTRLLSFYTKQEKTVCGVPDGALTTCMQLDLFSQVLQEWDTT